jgi:dolichyl-phosphate-mannose-protein mannosyltransferase
MTTQENVGQRLRGEGAPDSASVSEPTGAAAVLQRMLALPLARDLVPGLLFVIALVLFIPRLSVPANYIYDEVYHAYTAGQYIEGNADAYVWYSRAPHEGVAYTWNHPPAGLLIISSGIALWGDNSYGWRFFSAVFGAAGVVLAYALAYRLTRRRPVAVLAASLLLVDGLYFVQSRTAMLDIFGTFFMMAAFLSLHYYLTAPADRVHRPLLAMGLFMGLAIATKWNAAYPSALIGVVALWRLARLWMAARKADAPSSARAGVRAHLLWVPVALGAVPAAMYLIVYIPFFLNGHDFSQFIELQKQAYLYHSRLTATHTYQSSWWEWPLALRPVWYHVSRSNGTVANIYANGNPLLYWAFLPAVAWVGVKWWRERNPALVVLLIGFCGQWLPWALVPRVAFMYHFLPAVPFGALAVAVTLADLWRKGGPRRVLALNYGMAVVLAFAFFFPLYAALPLTPEEFEQRIWLESWR